MPPRGRPPKKNSRVTAAVENMDHMGFEKSLVKSTLQELLKLYTEDGWYLIEDNSYEVLREALLKKTASPPHEEEQEPVLLQQQEGEGDHGTVVAESSIGSSNMAAIENQENANTNAATEGEAPSSPPPPQRKREPYYGWISSSKEEAADREIIELPPMPLDMFEEKWSLLPLDSDLDLD